MTELIMTEKVHIASKYQSFSLVTFQLLKFSGGLSFLSLSFFFGQEKMKGIPKIIPLVLF